MNGKIYFYKLLMGLDWGILDFKVTHTHAHSPTHTYIHTLTHTHTPTHTNIPTQTHILAEKRTSQLFSLY